MILLLLFVGVYVEMVILGRIHYGFWSLMPLRLAQQQAASKTKSETFGGDMSLDSRQFGTPQDNQDFKALFSTAPQTQTASSSMLNAQVTPMEWRTSPQAMKSLTPSPKVSKKERCLRWRLERELEKQIGLLRQLERFANKGEKYFSSLLKCRSTKSGSDMYQLYHEMKILKLITSSYATNSHQILKELKRL